MRTTAELNNAITALRIAVVGHHNHGEYDEEMLKGSMLYALEWATGKHVGWLDDAEECVRNARSRLAATN